MRTRSWSRNASKLSGRKNAPRLRCSSAGSGWGTREPRGSLIFWNSAAYWALARARSRARFSLASTPRSSRRHPRNFMEGLGKKLREARLARGLTLDDAYRMTKIRPNRLEAIENEDFSLFDSLTYSKAAVLIYGDVLEVDVSPYLE